MATQLLTRPIYLQLRDVLTERIAKGEWKPGIAIPNEGDLARAFGVSPGTMRKALKMMEDEHLVDRRQGRGTFVTDASSEKLANRFCNIRDATGVRISGEIKSAPIRQSMANALECARLNLKKEDEVYRARRVRMSNDQPFMLEDVSLPVALFPGLAKSGGYLELIAALSQKHGMLLGKAEERLSIERATPEVAEVLGVSPAAPVLLLDRVTRTLDGHPVEWRMGRCHFGDDCSYIAEMS